MPLLKNRGPLLTSKYRGGVDDFPKEFLTQVGLDVLVQQVPLDIGPDLITGLLVESKTEQERTDERKKTNTFFTQFPDDELLAEVKLESGLVGSNARKLVPDPTPLVVDGLTESASQHNLGNGWLDQTIIQAPSLFANEIFSRERNIVTPEDFRALLQVAGFVETVDGTATDPVLTAGQISVTDDQIDVFHHRVDTKTIDILALPVTITNKRTNRFKQVETVSRILELDTTIPAVPTALMDVEFTKLGDGTALEVRTSVIGVFDQLTASIEVPDLIPDIFKAVLPVTTREFTESGSTINDPPVLGIGDLFRSESRETEFTRRIRTRGRGDPDLGIPILASAKMGGFEFGGGLINSFVELVSAYENPIMSQRYLSSSITNLGNGLWVLAADIHDDVDWPELIGTEVDPRTGIVVGIKKQVVPAGTVGGISGSDFIDVKPLDKWRSVQITSTLDTDSLPAPATWETTIEHSFPNTLFSIAWVWASATAPFAYDFDMVPVMDIKEGYSGPCRAKVTESYTIGPPPDVILPTLFCPQGHVIGFAWAFAAADEECLGCRGIARAHAQAWQVPPTLHGVIDLSGTVTVVGGTFTSSLPATTPTSLPSPGTLIVKACEVERWRFKVFYRRLVEIYVPSC